MSLRTILPVGGLVVFLACHSAKPGGQSSIEEFIESQLPGAEILFNASKDFALCLSRQGEPATGRKEYLVVEVATQKTITRGSFMPGYMKWLNDNELELLDVPGIVRDSEDDNIPKRIINIRKLKF